MTHAMFRDQLIALAGSTSADPGGFLDGLSPIHTAWHREEGRTYGFLLFHTRVVRSFKQIVAPAVQPLIQAFTEAHYADMGVRLFEYDLPGVDALAEIADFSTSIESWHNTAHMAIGRATGTPMMDPSQNIFFRPFWQLHYYIDDLFVQVLGQYSDRAHPAQFIVASAVASHIEVAHHGWVPRI